MGCRPDRCCVKVHLGGHLNWYDPQKRARFELEIQPGMRLDALIAMLGIPAGEAALALLNGSLADPATTCLGNGDYVELFPPSSGG